MVDACSVSRWDGSTYTFNEASGADVPLFAAVFSSRCKVQARQLQASEKDAGGREATLVRLEVHLPVSAGAVQVDDRLTITASTYDAQLVGRVFRVLAPVGKSFATARRVEVEGLVA